MNPLDLTGPEFLRLYLLLWLLVGMAWFVGRLMVRGSGSPPTYDEMESLHPYETAYLVGGENRAIEAAVAALVAANQLSVSPQGLTTNSGALYGRVYHPLDRRILETCSGAWVPVGALGVMLSSSLLALRDRLEQLGLRVSRAHRNSFRGVLSVLVALVVLLGIAKTVVGVSRERPVGFLVLLTILGSILSLILIGGGLADSTRKAELMKSGLSASNRGLQGSVRPLTIEETALAVGLFGVAVVATQLPLVEGLFPTPVANASSDWNSSSSSSCGGSSCGGSSCGGGSCGGGGCGGCGS